MKLVRIDNHAKTHKLLVFSVPLWLHNYISLYSLVKKKPKSRVLSSILDAWYESAKSRDPQEKLIQEVVERTQDMRKVYFAEHPKDNLQQFKNCLEAELKGKGKGLNQLQISIILKAIV
jgi:hypothetical protein